eukprot:1718388-Pleurochrysis_carterae.AAC.1
MVEPYYIMRRTHYTAILKMSTRLSNCSFSRKVSYCMHNLSTATRFRIFLPAPEKEVSKDGSLACGTSILLEPGCGTSHDVTNAKTNLSERTMTQPNMFYGAFGARDPSAHTVKASRTSRVPLQTTSSTRKCHLAIPDRWALHKQRAVTT